MNYIEYTDIILKYVQQGGPIISVLFPIIEAFIPVIPLVAFVIISVAVYGFYLGYLYSWAGHCIGSFLLFLFIRKVGGKKISKRIMSSKYAAALGKIRRKKFSVLFSLYCFPFTPSFLITGAAALTDMTVRQYIAILLSSKLIMMLSLGFIGQNVSSFFKTPLKSMSFIVFIIIINILSKRAFDKYEAKHRNGRK